MSAVCGKCETPTLQSAAWAPEYAYMPGIGKMFPDVPPWNTYISQPKLPLVTLGVDMRLYRQWAESEAPKVCPVCDGLRFCCCECVICAGCETETASETAPFCDRCEMCDSCCECLVCNGCDKKHSDWESVCDICNTVIDCCCECASCDSCGAKANPSDIHSACGYGDSDACGCCSCSEYEDEDYCCEDCASSGSGDGGMGITKEVEWREVAEKATARSYEMRNGESPMAFWGFDPASFDPAQAMCDYFLLSGINGVVLPVGWQGGAWIDDETRLEAEEMTRTVRDRFDALVAVADWNFRCYSDMAIGGELRYHRAMRAAMRNAGRSEAWAAWREIRADVGAKALEDAEKLFREIQNGTYGGDPWADATKLLWRRVTGGISASDFVNMVFSLQHNGGSFLNKVSWKVSNRARFNLSAMRDAIGPAHSGDHGGTGWSVLLLGASPKVVSLWNEAWRIGNRLRRCMGQPMQLRPNATDCLKRNGTSRNAMVTLPDGETCWYAKVILPPVPVAESDGGGSGWCKYGIPNCDCGGAD